MLKSNEEKLGYAIGIGIGKNISSITQELDHPALFKGIQDGISGNDPLLSDEEINSYLSSFDQIVSTKQEEVSRKKKAEQFLTENALKPGIISLPSGVQYKIVQMGQGMSPKRTNRVTVHYRGFLVDGKEFANTYQLGHPETFSISEVIKGWQEVLLMMKIGDIWHIYLPADLAYGKEGYGDIIGPNMPIAFQIELISIS